MGITISWYRTQVIVLFIMLLTTISGLASIRDVKPVQQMYGWVKPDTELRYSKNACGGPVYEKGYTQRGRFNEIEKNAYDYFYKGGYCTVNKTTVNTAPATFPDTYNYTEYLKLNPGEDHQVKNYAYTCLLDDATSYQFDFNIDPIYRCTAQGCYEEYPNCVGDLLARYLEIPGVTGFGHTAMYAGDKALEILVEEYEIIQLSDFPGFKKKTTYWGSAYNAGNVAPEQDPEISYDAAVTMVEKGYQQRAYYPEYSLVPLYKEGRYYVHDGQIHFEKGMFRCDTFVKYLYKKVLDIDLPPYNIYQVPFHQWKAFPYKRNPENEPPHEPNIQGAILAEQQGRTFALAFDDRLSTDRKAAQLLADYRRAKDRESKIRTFDAVTVLYSHEVFKFLLTQYHEMDDVKLKLRILSPLRYQYVHFLQDPAAQQMVSEVRDIYVSILAKRDNEALLRRAVEDMTIIFDPIVAERELLLIDGNHPAYRKPYLTSSLITAMNNHRDDALMDLLKTMSGCELTDHQILFEVARRGDMLSEKQYQDIQAMRDSASHDDNCIHQYLDNLKVK